jgi:hypothetical protein
LLFLRCADRLQGPFLAQPADELLEAAFKFRALLVGEFGFGNLAQVPLSDIFHDRVLLRPAVVVRGLARTSRRHKAATDVSGHLAAAWLRQR